MKLAPEQQIELFEDLYLKRLSVRKAAEKYGLRPNSAYDFYKRKKKQIETIAPYVMIVFRERMTK